MLSEGNSRPEVCALNLLRTVRGEVPYERIKGLSSEFTDGTASSEDIEEDIIFNFETYERRVSTDAVDVIAQDIESGEYDVSAHIVINDDTEDDDEEIVDYD
jgi:hypothetical protein